MSRNAQNLELWVRSLFRDSDLQNRGVSGKKKNTAKSNRKFRFFLTFRLSVVTAFSLLSASLFRLSSDFFFSLSILANSSARRAMSSEICPEYNQLVILGVFPWVATRNAYEHTGDTAFQTVEFHTTFKGMLAQDGGAHTQTTPSVFLPLTLVLVRRRRRGDPRRRWMMRVEYVNGEASREARSPTRGDAERLRLPHRLHSPAGKGQSMALPRRCQSPRCAEAGPTRRRSLSSPPSSSLGWSSSLAPMETDTTVCNVI